MMLRLDGCLNEDPGLLQGPDVVSTRTAYDMLNRKLIAQFCRMVIANKYNCPLMV